MVNRGAYRIDSSESFNTVKTVAFLNPDQSRGLVMTNDSDNPETVTV